MDLLYDLPFCEELSIVKISEAFKRYARSYKIETVDSKDPFSSTRNQQIKHLIFV